MYTHTHVYEKSEPWENDNTHNKGINHVFKKYWHNCSLHENSDSLITKKINEKCSFYAFLDWIAFGDGYTININKHWDSYYNLCEPCLIDYGFVSNIESAVGDTEDLKSILISGDEKNTTSHSVKNLGQFPSQYGTSHFKNNKSEYLQKISQIYVDHRIPKKTILKLYEIYFYDFMIFGYGVDLILENYGIE